MKEIRVCLFELGDKKYKSFQCALMPTVDPDTVIGVRTPLLRKMAKEMDERKAKEFMMQLPHKYYEENNLHAFLIEKIRDIDECYFETERFLPYINNWATCDSFSPKAFTKDKQRLLKHSYEWMESPHPYTVRFGIEMLMKHFLDEDYELRYAERVAQINSSEYYVKMMCAWYFATALAKQYESTIGFFEEGRLENRVHNKAIQKALESYRVKKEHKEYLKTLKNKTAD